MTIEDTDIILSVKDAVQSILEDAQTWTVPYTVYGIDSYRSLPKGSEPERPYAFLIAAREPIETRWLPVVLVDGEVDRIQFEMGHESRLARIRIHVLGRSQRDAMVFVNKFADSSALENLALYDHAEGTETPDSHTLSEDGWSSEAIPVPEQWAVEGTLKHWVVMENQYIVP